MRERLKTDLAMMKLWLWMDFNHTALFQLIHSAILDLR